MNKFHIQKIVKKRRPYLKTLSLMTNQCKSVMCETKRINPSPRPKLQTGSEREKLQKEQRKRIET